VPPETLADISARLDLLGLAASCDWWVIELMKPAEVLRTRDLLRCYLASLSFVPVTVPQDNQLPLVAA